MAGRAVPLNLFPPSLSDEDVAAADQRGDQAGVGPSKQQRAAAGSAKAGKPRPAVNGEEEEEEEEGEDEEEEEEAGEAEDTEEGKAMDVDQDTDQAAAAAPVRGERGSTGEGRGSEGQHWRGGELNGSGGS